MAQSSRAEKERKRRAVASAVIAGRGTNATASDIGCSKRYVRHLAAEPETRFLIAEILRPYHATLLELATPVITVVEEALTEMKTDEADHFTRLRAVELYCKLLELAQGKVQEKGNDAARQITWEGYVELHRSRGETTRGEEDAGR